MRISPMLLALAAALAEAVIGAATHLPLWLITLLALASGAVVLWGALALDLLARRAKPADTRIDTALAAQDRRLALAEARMAALAIDRDLTDAERELSDAAARIEAWDAPAADLPGWTAALERWSALAVRLRADLAFDTTPASDAELRAARTQLPPARNFSSGDLKAATAYLVQRDRIVAAYDRLHVHVAALWEADSGATPVA